MENFPKMAEVRSSIIILKYFAEDQCHEEQVQSTPDPHSRKSVINEDVLKV